MMKLCIYIWTLLFCVALLLPSAFTQTPKCDDVDTAACQLLQAQKHDFCSDQTTARAICPRFCKMCPIECYHCDATYKDYHQCNTTVLCQSGEVCMRKELISFADGHHEYEMTCQDRSICDGGSDLTIPFGKRHVNSRDISIKCCTGDFCNYPEITTTTTTTTTKTTTTTTTTPKPGCPKDIIFMVDDGVSVGWGNQDEKDIEHMLTSIVRRLDIGTNDNLIAYTLITHTGLRTVINLGQDTNKFSIISRINSYNLFNSTDRSNTTLALHRLITILTRRHTNDRPGYPDVIVVIGSGYTTHYLKPSDDDLQHLQQLSRDVIVLDVHGLNTNYWYLTRPHDDLLATDNQHIIETGNLHDNLATITEQIYQLIIQC